MIDWTRISQLEAEIGADELPALVPIFLDEVGGAIEAFDNGQTPTESALHFLKGCAMTLGFRDLAQLASEGENQKKTNETFCVDTAAIINAYHREREELLTKFPQD